ncbi:ATP-binding cassette domain-containing protein [Puniceibacterium sediminis]|uniref:ABC-type bacteriocin/lantibiotic exporter, contains an N-terminal double-glycine peptidase domain n=1 Tax=Puniceibacterium sediminis TaxID=1608407 RepID=A0A238ZIQ7_9RHOB|nr:ATP-binding cassette domain-containing protein [Puniceibacterium sediminis]SNR83130.1 ABC-type bacteriocin/lantibiotic exporter, contains an N-terminal double-glycine peptidase domain [Puniceibacterium sediminis]
MRDFFSRRQVWTPHRYQFQTTECGVGVLGIILAHYGRAVSMEEIRRVTGVSRDCLNAADIVAGARAFGLEPKVRRCEPETLAQNGFPVVVHLNFIHFAVAEGMTSTHVLLNDPHTGRLDLGQDAFSDSFTGIAITFTPTEAFNRDPGAGEHDPAVWQLLRPYLAGLAGALGGQLVSALALIWLAVEMFQGSSAVAAVALFAMGMIARNVLLARIQCRLETSLSAALLSHIMRLNTEVLNYRIPSRLAEVVAAPHQIAEAILGSLAPRWLDILSVPVLLVGLAYVAPGAVVVVAAITGLIGLCYAMTLPWQNGRMMPLTANGVDPADGLARKIAQPRLWKFAGGDRNFVTSSMGSLASRQLVLLNRHVSDTANDLLAGLTIPMLLGGAILWFWSQPDSGTLPQILFLTLALALPLSRLKQVRGQWRIANRLLADVRDIQAAPELGADAPQPSDAPDSGPVLMAQDVIHGFSRRKPARLHGLCLALNEGEQLGITGPSGGGKSTVGRVLAGLITPWTGQVTFLGSPVTHRHRPVWIDKQTVFFNASLRDNLTLWDDAVPDEDIQAALEIACIDTEVKCRPQGLETLMDPKVSTFSGGQLQRLEIARAVLRKPKVIILDEALDALNPSIEAQVRNHLRQQGISLVVISHRRSTLDACDRVLTVQDGCIVDGLDGAAQVRQARPPIDLDLPAAAAGPPAGLQDAFNAVTREMGLSQSARGTTLTQLADSADVLFRTQQFTPHHWRFEHAPSILLDDNGGATALARGQTKRLPAKRRGVALYDVRDQATRPLRAVLARALWKARRDVARMVALAAGVGAALFVWPLALSQPPTSMTTAGLALVLELVGLGMMQIAGRIAAVRMSLVFERQLLLQLLLRCRTMQTGALERISFSRLLNAVKAVGYLAESARTDGPAALYALCLSVLGLAYIAVMHGPVLTGLALVCALTAFAPGMAALTLRQMNARFRDENTHLQKLTAQLMAGLPRLLTLGADKAVSDHWRTRQSARATTALALWQRLAVIRVMPWVIALGGLTTMGIHTHPATALASLLALVGAANLGRLGGDMVMASSRLNDLRDLLDTPQTAGGHQIAKAADLDVVSVSHAFDGHSVLSDISAYLKPGSITVLAGASGSGKSTLLDLVLGVKAPVSGDIRHGNVSVRDLDELARDRNIGVVFQNDHLETACTLRAQLAVSETVSVARAWDLLDQAALAEDVAAMPMGLQTIVDFNTISTGQMQRLLIARQLAADPALLILDEAMNAVPDDIEARLIASFRDLGLTCLIVTHRESTIRLADAVIVLADGKVVHDGDPDIALARPEFRRVLDKERHVFLS